MDVIEKAIRGAFEKGNAEDKAFRERVYRSAFAALDRALQANPNVTVETAINRRKALQAKVTQIEFEFIPASPLASPRTVPPGEALMPHAPGRAPAAPPAPEPVVSVTAGVTPPPPPAPPPIVVTRSEPAVTAEPDPVPPSSGPVPPPEGGAESRRTEPPDLFPSAAPSGPAAAAPSVTAAAAEGTGEAAPPVVLEDDTAGPAAAAPEIDVSGAAPTAAGPEPQLTSEPEIFPPGAVDPVPAPAPPAAEPVGSRAGRDPVLDIMPEVVRAADGPAAAASPEVLVGDDSVAPAPPAAERGPPPVAVDPDAEVMRERRRPYAAMFLAVTLVTAGAIGLWWANETGLLKSAAQRDTKVPNPPAQLDSEDFIPEDQEPVQAPVKQGDAAALKNWVPVFTPANVEAVSAPSGTSAEVVEGEDGQVLRVRAGKEGQAVLFDVGQDVLEKIAGKHAIFDIVARAEEGHETEMSVTCNFGDLGDCGRKRYAVGHERAEFLFELQVPAGKPGAAGTIAVNSDVSNQGKAVDLFEIRVSTDE